jgi:hypothetical protein
LLRGFVVTGKFNPADADDNWPKWKDKKMPRNHKVCEIKLVAGSRGFGRLLFSWVLIQASKNAEVALVLEVIGSVYNQQAVQFYEAFEFVHSIAFDMGQTQVRDINNNIIYFMTKHKADDEYISIDLLNRELDSTKIVNCILNKKNETMEEETYCICKQPWNNRFMICCDACDVWYHADCIGLKESEAKKLKKFRCSNCRDPNDNGIVDSKSPRKSNKQGPRKRKSEQFVKSTPVTLGTQQKTITSYFANNSVDSKSDEKPTFKPPKKFSPCKKKNQKNLITNYFGAT